MNYFLSLGSNRGDRLTFLRNAITELAKLGHVVKVSDIYETEPVGEKNQDWYLNAVCVFASPLRPFRLLRKLKQIETRLGRKQNRRWAAREIDLDLIDWEGGPIDTEILKIPHREMRNRKFVLLPLSEVVPAYTDNEGRSIQNLLKSVNGDGRVQKYRIQW